MDEVIQEFLVESHESLQRLDIDLVRLENDPHGAEGGEDVLARVLRALHTLKGTAGVLGFVQLESLAHAGENLLCGVRDGRLELTLERTSALLTLVDALREILARIESDRREGDTDYAPIQVELKRLNGEAQSVAPEPPPPPLPAPATPAQDPQATGSSVADRSVRIDVDVLDRLMDQVGELVLARNQLQQISSERHDSILLGASQRLALITTELQQGIMKTRMQPVSHLWNKLPRMVRDLAVSCDKRVRLHTEGDETELDRSILEAFADPLTHLVRNCVDHGVEPPAEREAAGKPAEGVVFLRSWTEGGYVHIEVGDDGRGIDPQAVAQRAVESGILIPEHSEDLSERDLGQLIFVPGLSTAATVTNVSGRGVGMDVVKTNVERIGGAIEVQTTLGKGTTFRTRIPLTLAIVPVLLVDVCGDRYAIAQVNLLELVRLEGDAARSGIELIQDTPVLRLRGDLLPLVYLRQALGLQGEADHHPRGGLEEVNIVILQADGLPFGLVVDEIHDTEEIVVKPLGRHLRGIQAFAGATVLGDGRVALILDVPGLAQLSHAVSTLSGAFLPVGIEGEDAAGGERTEKLLLFEGAHGGRLAIALSSVARLENFTREQVEAAGEERMVQYRGELLPLLFLSRALNGDTRSGELGDEVQVVVYGSGEQTVGLVVDEIQDIVEEVVTIIGPSSRPGVRHTAVVQDRVTEILDIEAIVSAPLALLPGPAAVSEAP